MCIPMILRRQVTGEGIRTEDNTDDDAMML